MLIKIDLSSYLTLSSLLKSRLRVVMIDMLSRSNNHANVGLKCGLGEASHNYVFQQADQCFRSVNSSRLLPNVPVIVLRNS